MAPTPLVSVVIPVLNNWELTRECLSSLRAHGGGTDHEVLLVDNGSTDATVLEAEPFGRSLFGERFRLLRREENLGFARAINLGASRARGRYLYLLNNDTVVAGDPFAAPLALLKETPGLGAAGPLLLYPGGQRLQHLGIAVPHGIKSVHLYHLFPASHPVVTRPRRLRAITMAAFCVEHALFDQLGGLHEGYVNGMEDVDFCARMGREGLFCAVAPGAVVHHLAGQSAGRFARDLENSRLLASRCQDLIRPDMAALALADGYLLRLTPWLDPYLVPLPEREAELDAAFAARPDPASLPGLLEDEPCWKRGWDLLAGHFQVSGDAAGEARVRARQSAFVPTREVWAALADAARRAGDEGRLALLADQDARLRAVMARPAALRAQARAALARAEQDGDGQLAAILGGWLDENFPHTTSPGGATS